MNVLKVSNPNLFKKWKSNQALEAAKTKSSESENLKLLRECKVLSLSIHSKMSSYSEIKRELQQEG